MKHLPKSLKFLTFTVLILTLPACQSMKGHVTDTFYRLTDRGAPVVPENMGGTATSDRLLEAGNCPSIEIIEDLSSFYDFGTAQPNSGNLVSRVDLSKSQSACSYGPKSVTVDLQLAFTGTIGPQGRQQSRNSPFFSYPYFVAIMAPNSRILAKEVFSMPLNYGAGDQERRIEGFRQIIPVYNQEDGAGHRIAVGFQLTKEQLAYNRTLLKQRREAEKARQLEQKKRLEQQQKLQKQQAAAAAPAASSAPRIIQMAPAPVSQAPTPLVPAEPVIAPPPADPLDTGPVILSPEGDNPKKLNP
jgi:hypothetical protein